MTSENRWWSDVENTQFWHSRKRHQNKNFRARSKRYHLFSRYFLSIQHTQNMHFSLSFLVLSSYASTCHSFSQRSLVMPTIRKQSSLQSSKDNEAMSHLNARTCIKNFLTQRSVQSFLFLQEQCHDTHKVDWVEKFTNTSKLLHFHGTGGFNLQRYDKWYRFFLDMMETPPEKVLITVTKKGGGGGGGIGGWTNNQKRKKNPYLKVRIAIFGITN